MQKRQVAIDVSGTILQGDVVLPEAAQGIVLFAHGSGSSRLSPRNRLVAESLNDSGLGTLLMDLLTDDEEQEERFSGHFRFDIGMLADRLAGAIQWLRADLETPNLRVGLFGASTGAAAALAASIRALDQVYAIVSRGGRPDLAGDALPKVIAPTLLIVGSLDEQVLVLNQNALAQMTVEPRVLQVVPGASHLFEEPGALDQVSDLASEWFLQHLGHHAAR